MIKQELKCREDFILQRILLDQAVSRHGVVEQVSERIEYWHDERRPRIFNHEYVRAVY